MSQVGAGTAEGECKLLGENGLREVFNCRPLGSTWAKWNACLALSARSERTSADP